MAASGFLPALKLLMAVILAGWICVWVLKPTKVWKRSWHAAENGASKTFLGETGLNVVVLCCPVLTIAVLGYVYMHLVSEQRRIRRQRKMFTITNLSTPIIVNSMVGIVSTGELLTMVLFIALLVWTFYSNISSDFKKLMQPKSLHLNRWHLKTMRVGIRFGSLAEICLAVLFLPVLRGMALFKIIGIQFETSVRYHVWLGNAMILLSAIHGTTIMSIWTAKHSFWSEITKWQRTGRVNLAGAISLATGLVIWITSLPQIRRKQFQLFYSVHHLYIVFILFFLFHGGDRHFYLVLSGVLLLALDKILRIIQSRPAKCLVSAHILPCRAIELTLSKHHSVKYTPTSMIFLKIPSISKVQWHPFSIISSTNIDSQSMSVIIKCQGWWTYTLYSKIQSMIALGDDYVKCLPVAIEGPYGPSANIFQRYDSLILIAGGSGITPFLSILEEVASGNGNTRRQPAKVQLIYAVKRSEDLSMLASISPLNHSSAQKLKLKAFVTREEGPTAALSDIFQKIPQVQTILFDPKCPINAAPRAGGLLWKAVVTGLSSIIFLISLVSLSHTFLPTEKKNTENKNPSWINDLIVISSFVIATSCITVITVLSRWMKPRNDSSAVSREKAKVTDLHTKETTITPEEHEIYFGRRPNLTELLAELSAHTGKCEVGVFVCGPDSMEESVASFCRKYSSTFSGNTKTEKCYLTFHSVKFSL